MVSWRPPASAPRPSTMDPRFSIPDPPYCAGLLARPVFPPPRSAAIRLARRGTAASGTEPRALAPEPLSEGKHDVYHTCLLAARLLFAVGSRVPSLDTGNASGPSLKSWSTCWLHKVDCPVMVITQRARVHLRRRVQARTTRVFAVLPARPSEIRTAGSQKS
ncbi:unnamed protein product, partial [Prorocentrum cordatum]